MAAEKYTQGQLCTRCGDWQPVPASRDEQRQIRMRAGEAPGPRTAEGIERIRQARTVHGRYSAEMIALRREMVRWARLARDTISAIE